MNEGDRATLSVVVVGAGGAGVSMLTRLTRRPDFKVGAVVDVDDAALELASRHTGVPGFRRLEDALTGGQAQLVYIATPSELHASHAELAMELGADVLVEKPMAVSVSEARHMIDVSDRTGRKLLVCHKRSADPGPRHILRLVRSGAYGSVRMITLLHFSDWWYRPREPHDLDPSVGGGVVFRQGSHHFDIVRALGGGVATAVAGRVGSWDDARPGAGSYTARLDFASGAAASVVFSGYDHFDSAELTFGLGIDGQRRTREEVGGARRSHGSASGDLLRRQSARADSMAPKSPAGQAMYGFLLVSCERADFRLSSAGVLQYSEDGCRELPLEDERDGLDVVLDEWREAVLAGTNSRHEGRWGLANLEVCAALQQSSSASGAPIALHEQVAFERWS